jgi:hypothetical protein
MGNYTFSERFSQVIHYDSALRVSSAAWADWIDAQCARRITADLVVVHPYGLMRNFFDWVQRSKARSLADILGLDARLPSGLIADLESDLEAIALLKREEDLLNRIRNGKVVGVKIDFRHDLSDLHDEMHRKPALRPVLDLREGTAISLEEVREIGTEFGPNVVFC